MTPSQQAPLVERPHSAKCLGERFQDAFLAAWGQERGVAYADLPAEAQAKWNRAAVAFVCTLSDAPSEAAAGIVDGWRERAERAEARCRALESASPAEPSGWRPEVRAFADLMEAQLRANDHKPGWKNDSDLDLFERLGEESAELLAALHRHAKRLSWGDDWVMEDTAPRVGREAADVANFAMMIADVVGALPPTSEGGGA